MRRTFGTPCTRSEGWEAELDMGVWGVRTPAPDGLVPFASEVWGVQEKLAITGYLLPVIAP